MNTMIEGLVQAMMALPRDEKEQAFIRLLNDQEYKMAAANYFLQRIDKIVGTDYGRAQRPFLRTGGQGLRTTGNQIRDRYIDSLKEQGIVLTRVNISWSKSQTGKWVAMPLAADRVPNRWFLGLGEKDIIEKSQQGGVLIILLCQTDNEELLDFIIPEKEIIKLIPKMSKSNGNLKFNVKRLGLRYQMTLPGNAPFDITDYRGKVSLLKAE